MKNFNTKGFTLIELMIVVAIIAILAAILVPVFFGDGNGTEYERQLQEQSQLTICVEGYKFVKDRFNSHPTVQLFDDQGHGVPCTN